MKRFRHVLAVVALTGLIAAGCGNSDDDDDVAETDTGGTEETTTVAAGDDGASTTTGAPATDGDTTTTVAAGDTGGEEAMSFPTEFVAIEGVPGVSDEEISYGVIATETNNPLGTCVRPCLTTGIQAYFDYVNAQGGIYGRQLVIGSNVDDELANNQIRAEEFVSDNDQFGVFVATQLFSGASALGENDVPTYNWQIHLEPSGYESIFGTTALPCFNCLNHRIPYLANLAGATTVASLGYGISENSKICANGVSDSVDLFGPELGLTMGYLNDDIEFGLSNGIAPEVTQMLEAGVDFVSTCMDLKGMRTLAEEFERQGGGDVTFYHPNTYDLQFAREAGDLFVGDYIAAGFLPFEAAQGNPEMELFLGAMEALGENPTEMSMNGWLLGHLAVAGLVAAGPEFDRQSVIDATNTFEDYTAGGLVAPIDWGRQHVVTSRDDPPDAGYPEECFPGVQFDGENFTPIGGVETPWICWPNDGNTAWVEPEFKSFD